MSSSDTVLVPARADALRVGRAILEAHGQWETENNQRGGQDLWGEQHVILLGQAAMLAASPQQSPISGEAELREALESAVADLAQTFRWRGEGWECAEDELLGEYRALIAKYAPPAHSVSGGEDQGSFSQGAKIPTEQADEGVVVLQTPRGPIEVDASIAPLVDALNAAGFETKASCSGHGHRPGNIALRDGRELIIARNWCEGRRIDTLFPVASSGERMCEDGLPCPVPDLPDGYRCDGCDCERAAS